MFLRKNYVLHGENNARNVKGETIFLVCAKVEVIQNLPIPTDVTAVRRLLVQIYANKLGDRSQDIISTPPSKKWQSWSICKGCKDVDKEMQGDKSGPIQSTSRIQKHATAVQQKSPAKILLGRKPKTLLAFSNKQYANCRNINKALERRQVSTKTLYDKKSKDLKHLLPNSPVYFRTPKKWGLGKTKKKRQSRLHHPWREWSNLQEKRVHILKHTPFDDTFEGVCSIQNNRGVKRPIRRRRCPYWTKDYDLKFVQA
ncbi:hypothetical protein RRG08_026572 [Elysia crispata]|uniref:Uncharacterized protein n=1 Tax=Elysia crispata TaxID=231223 RepID=A0AAE0Y5H6_9GAST|nr:hypothetical protein RRG08_026572 [Elysia crispata]